MQAAEAGKAPARDAGPETGEAVGGETASRAASGSRSEAEADPGAAAAAKSRLPALVRTMTATAIDQPRQTGPVGRPGKAVLAGAAVGGALLVSVPFLVLGGHDAKARTAPTTAETVLDGNAGEAPGEFAVTQPGTGSSGESPKPSAKPGKPVREAAASAPAKGADKDEPKREAAAKPTKQSSTQKSGSGKDSGGSKAAAGGAASSTGKNQAAKPGSAVTFSGYVSLRSHLSGRCVDVPDGDFSDGKALWAWDCNGSPAQKWQFASDGTIRIQGKCLDVAGANYNDGTVIQIAWCNGNAAQQFVLNSAHDLVNTVVGKCVDIRDNNRGNGAPLQLWTCNGGDNQKWSV
ncbi:RICIN domain-containing protein [Streptomyces heilongjiangensis]|uniref:Ricin-type beta-trefoil lectin domain protein n=1 Tax=Streptomyces heilongjiangensis TaxID=945052 RepID=A0ABW1B7J6_9ACTN|nr:RICIN domain-containing protein [Streptomyces heilongjiangensis]MDC2947358.1 RICIN domain-containing protein [Streptomyces heilongjiangensis]